MPIRPNWSCAGCGYPWPCRSRRIQLLDEYRGAPASLALYVGARLVEAAHDLPSMKAGTLYQRFVGWLDQVPVSHRPAQ
jgi:hypothetical protein